VVPKCAIDPLHVPDLAGQESLPADQTLYLTIDLGIAKQVPKTAVYIPDRRTVGEYVNVILYMHGHKAVVGKGTDIEGLLKATRSGSKLWYPLRERMAQASNKNYVFVAPTLGDYSEGGCLIDKNTGAGQPGAYLQQVMQGLKKHLSMKTLPKVSNLILAAHSGGGVAMRHLAKHADIRGQVREAWCFDCLYSGWADSNFWSTWPSQKTVLPDIIMWAIGQPHHKLFIHTTGTTEEEINPKKQKVLPTDKERGGKIWRHHDNTYTETDTVRRAAKRNPNVRVEMMTPGVGHNDSPGHFIKDLIDSSSALK
jgi:hypothetical protein